MTDVYDAPRLVTLGTIANETLVGSAGYCKASGGTDAKFGISGDHVVPSQHTDPSGYCYSPPT